jgi:NhaP-type Na+/H+ or K+/H+ antiporter
LQTRLVYLTAVFVLGFVAQWLAWRMRLPGILLLLLIGFLAGQFASPESLIEEDLLFAIVSLSVAVILFEGGLGLRLRHLRETGRAVFRLVTVGILITWLLTTLAAIFILGMETPIAILLGAILIVSGPTVIVPLLHQVRPVRRVGAVAKWEGIVNDPIGAVLAVLVLEAILSGGFHTATVVSVVETVAVGGLLGTAAALLLTESLKRYWIPDFLQNLAFLATVVAVFTVSNLLQSESGLVTVTVFGIILANQKVTPIKHIMEFKENLRVLLISCLFILLASRLSLNDLTQLGLPGLGFLAVMLLVVRPATVFLSTWGTELKVREKLFLAWLAPRGIVAASVSSLFALKLTADSQMSPELLQSVKLIVPATFIVIVGTVTVYGLTAGPLANWLRLADANPQGLLFAGASAPVRAIASALAKEGVPVLLVDTNQRELAVARMEGLPTFWASVLSEYARDELELGGIGRLLAMTPNDEVNALACQDFIDFFGRAEVYQLPTKASSTERRESVATHRLGRLLFTVDLTYSRLAERFAQGATVKTTPLTAEFDYRAFRDRYTDTATVLFAVDEAGHVAIATVDTPLNPRPGHKLISLIGPGRTTPG